MGRVVLFTFDAEIQREIREYTGGRYGNAATVPAIVTRVWSEECVNLTAFPSDGAPVCFSSVPLKNENNAAGYHWEWPPRV